MSFPILRWDRKAWALERLREGQREEIMSKFHYFKGVQVDMECVSTEKH